jgi:hypothetical protein
MIGQGGIVRNSWKTCAGEFDRAIGVLGTYTTQECDAKVNKRIATYCTQLEMARYEAERVVKRLLQDHEAWG